MGKNDLSAQEWTMALCNELSTHNILATCDMFWEPTSDVKAALKEKIETADKIIVVVSKDYNKKISHQIGMASYEEAIYEKLIKETNDKNKILFILKEKNISLPRNWEDFNRIDLSLANIDDYIASRKEINEKIKRIIQILNDLPEYQGKTTSKKQDIPVPKVSKNFEELFRRQALNTDETHEQNSTLKEQERKLLKYIETGANQRSFVAEYIKAGLSADTDFNGRITPQLFIKHFFVERKDYEEEKYKRTIGELFSSYNHNMLCIQSDGGSGKSVFVKTIAFRYAQKKRTADTGIAI